MNRALYFVLYFQLVCIFICLCSWVFSYVFIFFVFWFLNAKEVSNHSLCLVASCKITRKTLYTSLSWYQFCVYWPCCYSYFSHTVPDYLWLATLIPNLWNLQLMFVLFTGLISIFGPNIIQKINHHYLLTYFCNMVCTNIFNE